jgi:Carboxypeptidase regulatory-like domain/TonB dependent receptor
MIRRWVLLSLTAACGFAQVDRSTLTGTIHDTSGGVLPNAQVLARNPATGMERRTRSTTRGVYILPNLPIGTYTVVFSAEGFRSARYETVEQSVGQTRTIDPVLEVSGKDSQVTIEEAIPQVDRSSAALSESLEQRAVQDLPLNGRNWASLTALVPGAIDQGGSTQRSVRFAGRGRDEMNITFDGVDATGIVNQAQKAFVRLSIPTSSIAEFRVDTLLPTAQSGDASGAQIAVASASGGNSLHGSLFEYFRNSDLDARSPFDLTPGPLPFHLNQFGGTFGGHIKKNKTFFFLNYEAIRQVQHQTMIGFVPAAALRSQILTQSPALAPILNAYPLGNGSTSTAGVQQYTAAGRSIDNEYSAMIRVDHRFSDSTTAYARFNYDDATTTVPLGTLADRQLNNAKPLNGAAELLHVFSPALVNEFKFGTNQLVSHAYNLTPLPYTVNASGFTALNSAKTSNQDGRTFSWIDNISLVRGRQVLKAGIEIRRVGINEGNSFDGTLTYSSLGNFVTNSLDSASYLALLPLKRMRKTSYFGYVQDEFRLLPNLTFNAGLRYEFYNAFHETTGRAVPFDFETCGGFCPANSPFLFPAKNNIDPRIGMAWSPLRTNGRTVFRIGYGIYHEDAQLDDQNFPTANDVPRYTLTRGAQFPGLAYPFESLLPGATGVASPKDQIRIRKDTYVQQWTASVQQSLPASFTGTVSYIASKGTNIMNRGYVNLLNPATGLRPYPLFGQIELRAKDSNSEFNGLQLSLQRSLRRGWLMSGNYMWSHAINDASLGSGVEDVFPENVSCRRCDRASSDQDARHSFSVFSVYELPFGNGRRFLTQPGVLRALAGGWEFSGILGGRTGLPVNITVTRAASALPDGNSGNQRPDYVGGTPLFPAQGQSPSLWITPAAFAVPAKGTWGNLGRNAFRGPALWQVDTAVKRRFTWNERVALEIRGECFNLLNRAQYGNPLADIAAPASFGRITSLVNTGPTGSGAPRQIELALRLLF